MATNKAFVLGGLTIGGVMIYSGLAGVNVMDVLAGRASLKGVDPKGGKGFDVKALLQDLQQGEVPSLVPLGALGGRPSKTNAKQAVEWAAAVGRQHGLETISSLRPGDVTSTGNLSNHAENNSGRAARDLSNTDNKGGSPEQEKAVRDILRGFGRPYRKSGEIIETFSWGELEVEIIYRTPKYGDHRGHIHVGAHT